MANIRKPSVRIAGAQLCIVIHEPRRLPAPHPGKDEGQHCKISVSACERSIYGLRTAWMASRLSFDGSCDLVRPESPASDAVDDEDYVCRFCVGLNSRS